MSNLRKYRESLNISQTTLAKAVGCTQGASVLRNPASMDDEGWARVANGMSQLADLDVWVRSENTLMIKTGKCTP